MSNLSDRLAAGGPVNVVIRRDGEVAGRFDALLDVPERDLRLLRAGGALSALQARA